MTRTVTTDICYIRYRKKDSDHGHMLFAVPYGTVRRTVTTDIGERCTGTLILFKRFKKVTISLTAITSCDDGYCLAVRSFVNSLM